MSNYWKKKLDELNQSNANSSSGSAAPADYWKQRLTELEKEEQKKKEAKKTTAPITRTHGGGGGKIEPKRTWFQKGLFGDGYDFGDVTKTILGTDRDVKENAATGVIGIGEKIVDALLMMGASQAQGEMAKRASEEIAFNAIRGKNTEGIRESWDKTAKDVKDQTSAIVAKDLYDEEKVAKAIVTGPLDKYIDTETDSVLGEKSDALVQSAGQLAVQYGANAIAPGSGMVLVGLTSLGSEAESALQQGATFEEATLSGAISAGAEMLTEKIGGINFGGKTLTDAAFEKLSRHMTSKISKFLITSGKLSVDALSEGGEEIMSGYIGAVGQKLTYMEEKEIKEIFTNEELFESFIGGVVLGGGGGTVSAVKATAQGTDYVSGLNKNEKSVVDKVYQDRVVEAEKNGKVTERQKTKIYDEVIAEMEKGYISTDTIEEVLGDRSSYDSLAKEAEEYDTLYNTASGQLSKAQQDRLAELDAKNKANPYKDALKNARDQHSQSVFELTKDTRLSESYNEKARRSQAYQADLTKYDAKQKAVIQKAIDSGILNNTRRTHEFVDMVAKISADKGVPFDFADNAKLKESGFALDGKVINGCVTKDGVTVNIDSAKSLNSVVGHEITHVLEGTEVYDALKQTLFDYAKSKGEYQSRYDSLAELYKNVKDANVEAELAADLVGDYLFTDADFINNLSTQNRNVFQKIYDEIKYLYKVATAGSKEARELEKVKKAFEKAYKEGGKAQKNTANDGVKYSIERTQSMSWAAQINGALYDGKNIRRNDTLVVGNPADTSVANEISDKPLVIPQSVLTKASSGKDISHSIKRGKLAKLDEGIKNAPITIVNPKRNAVVYVTNIKQGGLPIVVAFDMNTTFDGDEVHKATSIHLQVDTQSMLENLPESATVYIQKNELDPVGATNNLRGLAAKIKFINGNISQNPADVKYSLGEIVDENQHSYGIGVHLDSTLLDNLTPKERLGTVKEYVKELGGKSFTAYDPSGKAVDITIAKSSAKFKNQNGKRVAVNKDLTTKNIGNEVKQESIALVDELIVAAEFDGSKAPQYAHGWLDSNGQNDWEYWTTYVQDKNNTIWEATLNVANTANGEKVLYDISPIKKVGRSVKSDTIPTTDNVAQDSTDVKAEFSLSDSRGRQLSPEQQEYFKDSVVKDEEGNLKVMYHGTPNGDFTVFKDGTYFTDNKEYADRYQNPSASSISSGKVATAPKTFEVYLDIKKPFDINDAEARNIYINDYIKGGNAIGINPYLSDAEYDEIKTIDWTEGEDLRDFLIENGYDYDGLVLDEGADGGYGDVVKSRGTSYVVFSPEQVKNIDNLKPTGNPDIHRSLSEEDQQPKQYGNYNISGKDIALEAAPVAANVAAVQETVSEKESVAPVAEVTDMFPDTPMQDIEELMAEAQDLMGAMEAYEAVGDTASVEQLMPEYEAVMEKIGQIEEEDRQRVGSLTEGDIPPEMDAPYSDGQPTHVEDPFESRDWSNVGKRSVKAYMYENPEVKPFFQEEALNLLDELNSTTRGEKWYNDELYYESGGEKGFGGVKRHTSASMEELLDQWGMSYADIEKGLNAIIEDNGAENIAAAKKLEFMLNDRLLHGYKDFYTNGYVPPNQDYINFQAEKQITEYSKEAFDAFMAHADEYTPPAAEDIAPIADSDIAPVAGTPPAFYEVKTEQKNVQEGQQAMWEGVGKEPKRQTRKELHGSIIDNIKSKFSEKGFDLDNVLKGAKNLSTFATVDNTPQRVMEKALGYKEGQILSDITVNQVAQNETEGTKWLNSFTDRRNGLLAQLSKQYNIKPGSKQSAAAQMYAEGFYVNESNEIIKYGDAELAKDFPDFDVQASIKGLARDPRIRQIYDDTLAMINESRIRNAYPEIPRLDNYFLHFRAMDDTFSRLGLPFNPNDIRAKDLPTDLNGVTADLKPGQPYFASAMHRRGLRTSFDLLGGLERYLTSAKNQIYHIDDIQTLRALRNYIADTYGQANGLEGLDTLSEEEAQERIEKVYSSHLSTFAKFLNEEANVLAGKTALIDRGLEGILGRRGMTFLDTVNKQVGSNMVGFNISSSLTNFLPVAQTFAKTNKADFVKAFGQTVGNKIGSVFGKTDGFTENSPVVIRRKGADRFYRTPFQKVGDAGYVFMSAVDDISTELIARTKYNELIRKGMDSQKAHYETDKWVSRLMGDRSLGQMPQLYNSKMLGLITKFQLEVRNQLDSQFYDTIQEAKVSNEHIQNGLARNAKTAAKVTSTFVQLAVAQHLFGKAFESVAGYNPAFDIIEVIMTAFGFDDEEESEDTVLDNIEQGFLAMLEDMPYTSTFTGGRIPISSALPIKEFVTGKDDYGTDKPRLETLGEVAPYYVLPGGYGQIKKTVQGLKMFSDEHPVTGSYTDKGDLRFPVDDTFVNRVQAGVFGQYASENARKYFDNNLAPLNVKQVTEYATLGLSYDEYWAYRDDMSAISKRADAEGASDEDVVKSKYISSIDSKLSAIQAEKESIMDDASINAAEKAKRVSELERQFEDLVNERYNSYNSVSLDGDYAKIGNSYYQWYSPESGDPYWRKLTDSQVTKYTLTKNAGNAHYVTDGSVHYRRDQDGEWTKISDKQLERQREVTTALGITPEEYWSKTDISFMPRSEGEYEYAFEHPDNYAVAKAVGGYDAYKGYSKDLSDIKADKDKNGKSISGSRKEKVLDYINNLDADYGEKIILLKSEYPSDDTYNYEIIDYLNSREDISYSEMETILKELGFNVSSDGTITWD